MGRLDIATIGPILVRMKRFILAAAVAMVGCTGQVEEPVQTRPVLVRYETCGMRCALPTGITIDCAAIPDGYNGTVDEVTGDRCARWSWSPPYTGHCKTGSMCEVVTDKGDYLEGVCE